MIAITSWYMAQKILSFCCLLCKIVQSVAKKINPKIIATIKGIKGPSLVKNGYTERLFL